jgi:hypothetical protein
LMYRLDPHDPDDEWTFLTVDHLVA